MATDLPNGYRPSDDEPFMNERQREYFRRKLVSWKEDIVRESRETIQNLQTEPTPNADLADRASTEAERQLELRTRDRQRKLINKLLLQAVIEWKDDNYQKMYEAERTARAKTGL